MQPVRILLVEENASDYLKLRHLLDEQEHNYNMDWAPNYDMALKQIRIGEKITSPKVTENRYDVYLVGYDKTQAEQRKFLDWLYKFTSIPTILLTKNGDLLDTVLIEKHHAYSLCKEQFSRVQLEQSIRYLSNLIVWQKYKDRFQLIFENAFKISVLLKPNGILQEFNQAALTFFGNKHETVVGSIFWEMPWAIQSKKTEAKVKAAMTAAIGGSVAYCKVEA